MPSNLPEYDLALILSKIVQQWALIANRNEAGLGGMEGQACR